MDCIEEQMKINENQRVALKTHRIKTNINEHQLVPLTLLQDQRKSMSIKEIQWNYCPFERVTIAPPS